VSPSAATSSVSRAAPASTLLLRSASSKRKQNRYNLEMLNSQMNATIGVTMSPQTVKPKNQSKSLEEKRSEAEASRERLRNRFRSVVSFNAVER
jgi:hypothetical protein